MKDEEEGRYRTVLDHFGKFAQEFEAFKTDRAKALHEVEQRLSGQILIYWRTTAAALRQLSDWQAMNEDAARKERAAERAKRSRQEWIIIGLLLTAIVLEIWARWGT